MPQIWITFIDVGWGDSILLEVEDNGTYHFGLVDANDTANWPSSKMFLKRHFERYIARNGLSSLPYPLFEFVAATHPHADHIAGLQGVIRQYGTDVIYSPRFDDKKNPAFANVLRWAGWATRNHIRVAKNHVCLAKPDTIAIGPVDISVLWPPPPPAGSPNDPYDKNNENHNSLVLSLKLGTIHFVLTGDCEAKNWRKASDGTWPINLPSRGLKMVQIPHHGAENGLFDGSAASPLLQQITDKHNADTSVEPLLVVSCHPHPHNHPHPTVASELDAWRFPSSAAAIHSLRTDENLHFTVWTDGTDVETRAREAV